MAAPIHRSYTIGRLAELAGVSVRALHHYDAIGLLKPVRSGANGYRRYGRDELHRLQQILIYRALDIPLADIAALLAAGAQDRLASLRAQRARLAERLARDAAILATIDRTIATLEEGRSMTDAELYSGLAPEKQAAYEAWIDERFGAANPGPHGQARAPSPEAMAALKEAEAAIAACLRESIPADSPALDAPLERHRAWVSARWGRPCSVAAYRGLAEVYEHPDFRSRYERIAPGLSDYLVEAMRAWAGRQAA